MKGYGYALIIWSVAIAMFALTVESESETAFQAIQTYATATFFWLVGIGVLAGIALIRYRRA